ncbi:reverse gyrase [Pyrolobus fumarii 1A]|uniref:Reverse gyrase n=1 Tax=Pyrolobus fumarii (strain DSM 11204 / 1A) TaxID=694429 RepID=G0EHE8_PYRF1|nr:reverse gyrase [Pyrolobus fumarii]AEM38523.1 reverse gyrase [Pyrolobus fumarii 1A]
MAGDGWRLHGVYWYACPHCGGPIGDDRLYHRLPCARCLPDDRLSLLEPNPDGTYDPRRVAELLEPREDSPYLALAELEREVERAEAFFEKAMGSRFWSVQRTWLRRVLRGKSFAAIAPTGIGKTTFGTFTAVYLAATRGVKSYIVVPTTPLVEQVEERARRFAEAIDPGVRIVAIHSRLPRKELKRRMDAYRNCDFDVLITTSSFMLRHVDEIISVLEGKCGQRFYLVFVDDVDSVLKSSKSVDAVLKIVGFSDEDIKAGWELLKLRREIARLSARARSKGEIDPRLAELIEKARELEKRFEGKRRCVCGRCNHRDCVSVLVVSSATGRPRGTRVRLFSVLLGFEAGSRPELYRNIVDTYVKPRDGIEEEVVRLVKRLGDGGLVYVPVDKGASYAERLAQLLSDAGVRAEPFTARNPDALERFRRGETQVLVGVAIYYGVAVRGLDLPERIRYAVFAGVPRHKFSARFEDPHPTNIMRVLGLLAEHAPDDVRSEAEKLLARLRRIVRRLSAAALQKLAEELRSGEVSSDAARLFQEALRFVREALSRSDVWEALEKAPDVAIVREGDKSYIMIPDVATYIQASGRTSRLYAGGITKGLSVIVVDDDRLLEGLRRRLRWYIGEAEIRPLEEVDLDKLLREIDEDRRRVRDVLSGRVKPEYLELVKTALLIVESPNKARTIARFFGRPSVREIAGLRAYEVSTGDYVLTIVASGGHIYDLAKTYYPLDVIPSWWLREFNFEGRVASIDEFVTGFDWSSAENKHGVFVAKRGSVRYLPVYTPLVRCPDCGFQSAANPSLAPNEEQTIRDVIKARLGKDVDPFDEKSLPRYCPRCGSPSVRTSLPVIEALRELASEVDMVMIGTDPDTEGEKIGWDVAALIAPFANKLVRVEFHEVTRKAILEAIRNPRPFNPRLVEAQTVRRVEDRWIGFTLSPILWRDFWLNYYCPRMTERLRKRLEAIRAKIRALRRRGMRVPDELKKRMERIEALLRACEGPNRNLSAGRVQTPVLGWVIDRWSRFSGEQKACAARRGLPSEECPRLQVTVSSDGVRVVFEAPGSLAPRLRPGTLVELVEVGREVVEENPLPPYTTDTMLADAWDKLRLPAPVAMQLAQELFEMGFITYHRTDSTRVSDAGIAVAREYIRQKWGEEGLEKLFRPRRWEPPRLIGVEAAHEAIRPTRPIDADTLRRLIEEGVIETPRPLTKRHLALYDLIFRRFIASQMAPARVELQVLEVRLGGEKLVEVKRRAKIVEEGFLMIYKPWEVEGEAPAGEYRVVSVRGRPETWPLTQAEVVRMMKERKIGRPSTYARIVETLHQRKYVKTLPKTGWLMPMPRGRLVYKYLAEELGSKIPVVRNMISEERTRELLEQMDLVEEGKVDYQVLLDEVYRELLEVEKALKELTGGTPTPPK